jgi:hypothetical protein
MDNMEQLITVDSGVPAAATVPALALELSAGAPPLFPEDNNEPTTGDQLGVTVGKPPIDDKKAAQDANASMLSAFVAGAAAIGAEVARQQIVPGPSPSVPATAPTQPTGSTLTVTASGNISAAGAAFPTTVAACPSPTTAVAPTPAVPGVQPAALHAAPPHDPDEDADDGEDDFNGDYLDPGEFTAWSQALQPVPPTTAPRPAGVAAIQIAAGATQALLQQVVKTEDKKAFDAIASAATAANPAPTPAPAPTKLAGEDVLFSITQIAQWIDQKVQEVRLNTGIAILSNSKAAIPNSYVHEAIRRVSWEANNLPNLGPHELLNMEAAITAHQVYVQGEENYWTAQYNFLGRELERAMIAMRDNFTGGTKAEMENKLIANHPGIRDLRNKYLLAQALCTVLDKMGERFAQMEDGLKRTISFVVSEYQRTNTRSGTR